MVLLFSALFPFAPLLALCNNIIELRSDAYKYLFLYRRYDPEQAQSLGSWFAIIRFLSLLSISTNSIIVAFLSQSFEEIYLANVDRGSWLIVRLLVVIAWHIILNLATVAIAYVVRDTPKLVQIARTREIMMERYLIHGLKGESYEDLTRVDPVFM